MHGCLLELLPPASLDFAIEAYLLSTKSSSLVVEGSKHSKIISRHPFAAKIIDIHRIPNAAKGFDRLLLAFPSSQFAILEYRRDLLDFVTVSMHAFNKEDFYDNLVENETTAFSVRRMLTVEPESRCAVMRVHESHLAILPFSNSTLEDAMGEERPAAEDGSVQKSWLGRRSVVLPFAQLNAKIRNVVDFVFLPGYLEPTLAVLYEPEVAWPLRYPSRKDTVCLAIVTIDLRKDPFSFMNIALYEGLPSDLRSVWACSKLSPVKGVLLPGANDLLHIDPGNPTPVGIALNSYASYTTKLPALRKTGSLKITFEGARFLEVGEKLLIASDTGSWFRCQVYRDSGSRRLELLPTTVPSPLSEFLVPFRTITKFGGSFIATVPVCGDALIYEVARGAEEASSAPRDADMEDDLYDPYSESQPVSSLPSSGEFDFVDRIFQLGPITDFVVGGSPQKEDLEIATSAGRASYGSVCIFKNHVPFARNTQFQVSNSQAVFPVVSQDSRNLYVISTESSSLVLLEREGLVEELSCSRTAIFDDEPTILAAPTNFGVVQVTSTSIKMLSENLEISLATCEMGSFSRAVKAAFGGGHIIIEHEDHSLTLYKVEENSIESVDLGLIFSKSNSFSAWNFHVSQKQVMLVTVGGTVPELCLWELPSMELRFRSDALSPFPVLLTNTVNCGFKYQGGDDISGVAVLESRFNDFYIVLSSKSCGIVLYQMLQGETLVRLPMSAYSSSLCSLTQGTLEITLHNVNIRGRKHIVGTCKEKSWLVSSPDYGYPRVHAIRLPKKTSSVTEDFGVYETTGTYSKVHIDPSFNLDYEWPFMRQTFSEIIRSIVYHSPSSTYVLTTIMMDKFVLPKDEFAAISDNLEFPLPPDPIPPQQGTYMIKLLSPRAWKIIDEYQLNENEYALCLSSATLETKQTTSGRQPFIAVGTSTNRGEDRLARGRVLIFDVIEVVPELDRPETDRRLKLLTTSDMKGPVTTLCHLNGYLLVSIGPKLIIHTFENNESLTGVGFVDVGVYGTVIAPLKNFFLVGDICKSLSFHAFQEKPPKVVTLGRDFEDRAISAAEYVLMGDEAAFVVGDALGNLHLLSYIPTSASSGGGMRLVHRGSMRASGDVRRMRRVVIGVDRQACLIAANDGSVLCISPIDEDSFRTLYTAQLKLLVSIPHAAGIHPRTARQVTSPLVYRSQPVARNLIDMTRTALLRLADLPRGAREHLALNMLGLSAAALMDSVRQACLPIWSIFQ